MISLCLEFPIYKMGASVEYWVRAWCPEADLPVATSDLSVVSFAALGKLPKMSVPLTSHL